MINNDRKTQYTDDDGDKARSRAPRSKLNALETTPSSTAAGEAPMDKLFSEAGKWEGETTRTPLPAPGPWL